MMEENDDDEIMIELLRVFIEVFVEQVNKEDV